MKKNVTYLVHKSAKEIGYREIHKNVYRGVQVALMNWRNYQIEKERGGEQEIQRPDQDRQLETPAVSAKSWILGHGLLTLAVYLTIEYTGQDKMSISRWLTCQYFQRFLCDSIP